MMCVLYYGFYTQNQIDIWFCSWMKLFVVVAILEMRTNKQIHEMYKWHQSRNTKYTQVQFDLKIYSKIWKYHRYESFCWAPRPPPPSAFSPEWCQHQPELIAPLWSGIDPVYHYGHLRAILLLWAGVTAQCFRSPRHSRLGHKRCKILHIDQ